jgi:hypothetical protein
MRPTSFSTRLLPAALIAALAVAACSSDAVKPNPTPANYQGLGSGSAGDPSAQRMGGEDSGVIFGMGKGRSDQSGDPFGGVIITDWYTPPGTSGERFKATVYILSRELRSDGVRVNIFRQVLQNGQWLDSPVSDQTVGDIENKILARARRMREQMQASS